MTQQKDYSAAVIDLFPWNRGLGFEGAEDWWRYVRSRTEREKLELLVMAALLNSQVALCLLTHDQMLFQVFELSGPTQIRLLKIDAPTLEGFVQQYRLTLAEE